MRGRLRERAGAQRKQENSNSNSRSIHDAMRPAESSHDSSRIPLGLPAAASTDLRRRAEMAERH
jgi:hypothetical protein